MEKIKMTFTQFIEYISNQRGCQFVNIVALTDAPMYVKNNPYKGRVQKCTITPMQIGYDYAKAVNNRLKKQGIDSTFVADKLPWGHWVINNKVIMHKEMLYLRTYAVRGQHPKTYYFIDGRIATPMELAEIKAFLKPSSVSDKQSASGLEEEFHVRPRDYKFTSIVAITMNHTRIYLTD
jgi:hypothetical protein